MKQVIWFFLFVSLLHLPATGFSEVLYSLDFSQIKDGEAESWLKENQFVYKLDADKLDLFFKDGSLVVSNSNQVNGLLYKEIDVEKVKSIRIEWGVNHFPSGVDWENGVYRDTIMIIISFGKKKISSGSFIVPNLPYFIGIFLAENEEEGKAYTGSYFQKGGRYFCSPCGAEAGKTLVTQFELHDRFKSLFGESTVPPVSAIAIESDTRDLKGSAEAYLKKIEFLSQ